jgi:hypothetical protein
VASGGGPEVQSKEAVIVENPEKRKATAGFLQAKAPDMGVNVGGEVQDGSGQQEEAAASRKKR